MDNNKPMAIVSPNLDEELEDSSLCLEQFKCEHVCYEPRHNSHGIFHWPCVTLVNAHLKCGHTEMIHCFEARRTLRCSTSRNVQLICCVHEVNPNVSANNNNNNNNSAAPVEMHLDRQRANEPAASSTAEEMMVADNEMDTDSGISSGYDNSQNNNPAPPSAAIPRPPPIFYNTAQTTVIQPERDVRYRLGKRNFDGTISGSGFEPPAGNFDYRRDETSAPATKKCGMDTTNAKGI